MKLSLNKGFDGGGREALEGPIGHFGIHSTCEVNFRLQLFASCCLPVKIFVHANTLSMLLTEMPLLGARGWEWNGLENEFCFS